MILLSSSILSTRSDQEQQELVNCSDFANFQKKYKELNINGCHPQRMWREVQTKKLIPCSHFPISSKFKKFVYDAEMIDRGESRPQFFFSLCAISSLTIRYLASIHIQLYVELTQADERKFNQKMVSIIEQATDGEWQSICTDVLNQIKKASRDQKEIWKKEKPDLMELYEILYSLFHSKVSFFHKEEIDELHLFNMSRKGNRVPLKKTGDLFTYLIGFRNKLIHAEKIPEPRFYGACAVLLSVFSLLKDLWKYSLRVQVDESLWNLSKIIPEKLQEKGETKNKQITLQKDNNTILELSPLVCISQNLSKDDIIEDLFFINVGRIKNLDYLGFQKSQRKAGKVLGTYEQFKDYIAKIPTPPISKEDIYNFDDYAFDKAKNFVGREDVLQEIHNTIHDTQYSYIELRALAGMGKTAIMSHLYQKYEESEEDKEEQEKELCWVFHFCMNTEGRNTPIRAYRSLIANIGKKLDIQNYRSSLSWKLKELKENLPLFLNGEKLKNNLEKKGFSRLVIAIDALDEGFGGEESVVDFIPYHLQEHIVFLYSYRVNKQIENRKVQNILHQLPEEKKHILSTSNPLKGLTKDDVQIFLKNIHQDIVPQDTYEQVWSASSQDLDFQYADPFYLRFLLDGVQQNRIFINRSETIPASLDDAFESKWLSLPTDFRFLGHRLLLTLAIMRDHGDDELFMELFNRNKRYPEDENLSINDIRQVRLAIGKLLIYDGDRYTLFHDRFRYFLVGEQKDPIEEALGITDH